MKINFSLFSNKNKQAENSPDFWLAKDQVVEIHEPGQYRVVGWKKPLKDGAGTYLSCVFEKVGETAAAEPPPYTKFPQQPTSRPTSAGGGAGPTSYGRSQTTSPAAANARVQRPLPSNGMNPAATGSFDADALPF